MAFNGSGVFNRVHNWVEDKNNSIDINATRMDAEDDGFATGLSTCITKDGQTTITADIPFSTHKITGLGDATTRTGAATLGQIVDGGEIYAVTSGTDTYTATLTPIITAYVTGMQVNLHFANANASTTPTLNINSVGAKTIVRADGSALVAGDIDGDHVLRYDGTDFRLLNPIQIPATDITDLAGASIVTGPSSSTTGNVPKFADATGKALADGYGVGTGADDIVQMNSDANWPTGVPVPVGASRNLKVVRASATTLAVTADEIVCKAAKGGAARIISSLSVTLNIANTGANGMDTGSASASADLSLYAISGDGKSDAVLACLGSTSNGAVYSGTNMPTGYTASALIGTYKMNSSAQFNSFVQHDRVVQTIATSALTAGTASTYTSVSISSIVPSNSNAVSGTFNVSSSSGSSTSGAEGFVAGDSTGLGEQVIGAEPQLSSGNVSGLAVYGSFRDLIMATAQTIYYKVIGLGVTTSQNMSVNISGYTF